MGRPVSPMVEVMRAWWKSGEFAQLDLHRQIVKVPDPEFTVYRINHQMPDLSGQPNRWRITTKRQTLKSEHFGPDDRDAIKRAFNKGKGRAVYALDLTRNQVLAAVSYHYDDNLTVPILLLHVARRLASEDPALAADSHRAALILKTHLHFLKPVPRDQLTTPGDVWTEVPEREVDAYGYDFDFRRGKQDVSWHQHRALVALWQNLPS